MSASVETVKSVEEATGGEYKYGFYTDIEVELAPKGLNEDIVRFISAKKDEPDWLLEWRVKAFNLWNLVGLTSVVARSIFRTLTIMRLQSRGKHPRAWMRWIQNY